MAQRLCHYLDYIQDAFPAKPIILDIPHKFIQKYNSTNPEVEWSKLLYEQGKKGNIDFDEVRFVGIALRYAKNSAQQKKEIIDIALKGKSSTEQESLAKELVDNHLLSSSDLHDLLK